MKVNSVIGFCAVDQLNKTKCDTLWHQNSKDNNRNIHVHVKM